MGIIDRIFKIERDVFGLDIGFQTIKIAQLKKRGAFFKLTNFGYFASPKNPFAKEHIKDKKALTEAISQAKNKIRLSTKSVVSALPESVVFTKIIQLPKLKPEELKNVVAHEAINFIPLEPNQTYLDFQLVGESNGNYHILVVAAPKRLVDDFVEVLEKAGLSLVCLETKPLSNIRALVGPKNFKEEILIVDLGAVATSCTICKEKAIKLTVTFSFGSQLFTEKIASVLGVKLEKAEEIKIKNGITGKAGLQIKQALEGSLGTLADKIIETLNYYRKNRDDKVGLNKVILTGGGALMPGLRGFLEDKIGLRVELGDPWRMIKNPPSQAQVPKTLFTTAIGSAMRQRY